MSRSAERTTQKSRTREAILAGARELMARGAPVSVTQAAAVSGISKATAYRYFSDPAALAAEAGLSVEVKSYEEIVAGTATLRERLRAISLYFIDLSLAHEPAFRQFLARNLDAWSSGGGARRARRGARRVEMLERALSEAGIDASRRTALVRGLSAATGAEAMIALLDIVRVDADTARATVLDIVDALIDRHMGPIER
jgi:AcrR family transcriptional regulator